MGGRRSGSRAKSRLAVLLGVLLTTLPFVDACSLDAAPDDATPGDAVSLLAMAGPGARGGSSAQTRAEPIDPDVVTDIRRGSAESDGAESDDASAEPGSDGLEGDEGTKPVRKTDPELDEVYWVTEKEHSLDELASIWGMRYRDLRAWNPELIPKDKNGKPRRLKKDERPPRLPAGTRVKVFEKDPERSTRSIGAPNRGRLVRGIPLPQGKYWQMRERRRRTFGTHKAITSLLKAFRAFGAKYPDGPKIRVGEIAARRGGRVPPHKSHRTGRDVDIGYLMKDDDPDRVKFKRTTKKNFDLELNWALVKALLDTGNVQTIYMNSRRQQWLVKEARKHLSEEEVKQTFQYPWSEHSGTATIRHSRGHKNHLHVRFRCEDWNRRCRARSKYKAKKRKKKKKKSNS